MKFVFLFSIFVLSHGHILAQDIVNQDSEPREIIVEPESVAPSSSDQAVVEDSVPVLVKPVSPAVAGEIPKSGPDALKLQIFLDQHNFGPGVIDGAPGLFTVLAAQSWNNVNGHPAKDWTSVTEAARNEIVEPIATAIVPSVAKQWVNPNLPSDRKEQAKLKRMSYKSLAEFMAERYHTDVPFLVHLNGKSKIYGLKAKDSILVPNVKPFIIEEIQGVRYKEDATMTARHVVVDTKKNQLWIFESSPQAVEIDENNLEKMEAAPNLNKGLIASFPITPGKKKFIKYGLWKVKNAVEFPGWRYDKQLLEKGKRGPDFEALEIPSGPNSPVGVFWCGLSHPGIGLHGTADPETIGRAKSSGCVRLANWDAIRLPTLIRPGTSVEIR